MGKCVYKACMKQQQKTTYMTNENNKNKDKYVDIRTKRGYNELRINKKQI